MAGTLSKIDASEYRVNGDPIDFEDLAGTLTLDKIEDVTASADEVNLLDGVTATTTELNIVDGITATTAEINKLDGVASTTEELDLRALTAYDVNPHITGADCYVMSPFNGTVTHVYVVSHGTGVGTAQVTVRNNAGSSMGAINIPTTAGGTNVLTVSSNGGVSSNQKIHFDTTTTATSSAGVTWTVRFQIT